MIKKLINSKEELIDLIWGDEGEFNIDNLRLYREDHQGYFGVEFLGKEIISGDINDDGEWAGKEHYIINEDKFPISFPAIAIINSIEYRGSIELDVEYVYINDFNININVFEASEDYILKYGGKWSNNNDEVGDNFRVYGYPEVELESREEAEMFLFDGEIENHMVAYSRDFKKSVEKREDPILFKQYITETLDKLYEEYPDLIITFG